MTSWLSSSDSADLTAINLDGHDTLLAVSGGGESVVFARYSAAKDAAGNAYPYDLVAAQTVLVEYTAGFPSGRLGVEAVRAETIDGYLTRPVPFNVQTGDLFSLGTDPQEQACIIVGVDRPALGTQRALFRLRVGEQ